MGTKGGCAICLSRQVREDEESDTEVFFFFFFVATSKGKHEERSISGVLILFAFLALG
jgi:hypothetical protein